jgi:hypothetical protein
MDFLQSRRLISGGVGRRASRRIIGRAFGKDHGSIRTYPIAMAGLRRNASQTRKLIPFVY